jgi:hypothetical protein
MNLTVASNTKGLKGDYIKREERRELRKGRYFTGFTFEGVNESHDE